MSGTEVKSLHVAREFVRDITGDMQNALPIYGKGICMWGIFGAPRATRTPAPGSGGRCSIH